MQGHHETRRKTFIGRAALVGQESTLVKLSS
jgi:hypothetical protein